MAQITRTSQVNDSLSPTRRTSPLSRNRSSLACMALGSSPISSRNSVPPLATSNRPDAVLVGPGERPFAMAEQLALDQVLGQCPAVDRHEGHLGPQALVVDRAGDQFLARAGLAEDQHGRVGRRDLGDQSPDAAPSPANRRSGSDGPSSRSSRCFSARYLLRQLAFLGHAAEHGLQSTSLQGLVR